MRKNIILIFIFTNLCISIHAQEFNKFFTDKTLRIDYTFSGNARQQSISIDELSQLPLWAGRRHHLSESILNGNGEIEIKDLSTQTIIYRNTFSTLFQEWLTMEEAQKVSRSFENTFLLPYPLNPVEINILLKDNHQKVITSLKHTVDPNDILIRKKGNNSVTPHKYLFRSGNSENCIDLVILGEGYAKEEINQFYTDAAKAYESIFTHEPFLRYRDKFNVIAVFCESSDSGVSIPQKGVWKKTIFSSHFSTFYSERYLTTKNVKAIHNMIAGIPYEHIIILANTEEYGGGGIYNSFTLTSAHHKSFPQVIAHEFGHSFAGLADEYFYDEDIFSDTYPFDIEPWEQNITTLVDFESKWKDMLPGDASIPTTPNPKESYKIGIYEGGGYSAKGIYRPAFNCRMRTNNAKRFCPVCQRAIERVIKFYTNK